MVGRANRAGFAEIGKVYARMAKASVKMGNKEQAISYLEDAQVKGSKACFWWHSLEYLCARFELGNGLLACRLIPGGKETPRYKPFVVCCTTTGKLSSHIVLS